MEIYTPYIVQETKQECTE